jgi:hypothetical protein
MRHPGRDPIIGQFSIFCLRGSHNHFLLLSNFKSYSPINCPVGRESLIKNNVSWWCQSGNNNLLNNHVLVSCGVKDKSEALLPFNLNSALQSDQAP